MKIEHLTNGLVKLGSELSEQFTNCTTFSIATTFISASAIDLLERVLKKNKKLTSGRLLIGIYGYFNQKADLLRLQQLEKQYADRLQVHVSKDKTFHWKYYHFTTSRKQTIYIGSANFTSGGLGNNGEVMLKLTHATSTAEKSISQLQASFDAQWRQSGPISKLRLDLYPSIKAKTPPPKIPKEFQAFFEDEGREYVQAPPETIAVTYLTHSLRASTEKKISTYHPEWMQSGMAYFVCIYKSHFEQCLKSKRLLILDRQARGEFYAYWGNLRTSSDTIKTDDGKYFIAYRQDGRDKRLKPKHEEALEQRLGIDLRAVKKPFTNKLLRKNQAIDISFFVISSCGEFPNIIQQVQYLSFCPPVSPLIRGYIKVAGQQFIDRL